MQKMQKKISVLLLALLISLIQLSPLKADAAAGAYNGPVLAQWILDEPTNTLYAISQSGKSLLFINATTMNIEKTLTFDGWPRDIIKDSGKLYISVSDRIEIVDMVSRTITDTIHTTSFPFTIEKEGDKIYYHDGFGWTSFFELDLITKTDKQLPIGTFHRADIAINPKDHILYIGESGMNGCNMIYYSTSENKIISRTDSSGGFNFPKGNIIFDGEKVYYAGYDFDKLNATHILGHYDDEDIIFTKYGLCFTKTGIYNSETQELLDSYDDDINLYEISSQGVLYLYSEAENDFIRIDPNQKGWVQENGKWYYYDPNTHLKRTGWLNDCGIWYYLNADGSMAIGWVKQGANWYYLQANGAMKTGWLLSEKKWYYLNPNGSMKTGWLYNGGSWYYLNSGGDMKTGWLLSGSKWYFLYDNGRMAFNTNISGYRFGADGAWVR